MAEHEQDALKNKEYSPGIKNQKFYIKDISFETPNSPEVFTMEWNPKLHVDLGQQAIELPDGHYEVVLTLTVTTNIEDKVAYLAEVQQAGIFYLQGFEADRVHRILNVYCLRMLYPYACFVVSDLVTRGGFPQLLLAPVNFEVLYKQRFANAGEQDETAGD